VYIFVACSLAQLRLINACRSVPVSIVVFSCRRRQLDVARFFPALMVAIEDELHIYQEVGLCCF
jgi:hypothetical protein